MYGCRAGDHLLHALVLFAVLLPSLTAAFLSSNRQGSFFLPLVLVLPAVFGLRGLEAVQGVSDFLSFLAAIPFAVSFLRKLKQKEDRN